MHDCSEDSNRPRKCAAKARNFAHCDERPKALPLETASIFEKLLDQKTFRFKISKDFFDKLRTDCKCSRSYCLKSEQNVISSLNHVATIATVAGSFAPQGFSGRFILLLKV